jgi:hypothetical protein
MLKNTIKVKEILHTQNSVAISHQISPSLLYVSSGNCQRVLVNKSGMIKNQGGMHNTSEMIMMKESPCAPTP